ncbi:MAG: response regulator, partial [Chloroflexi bacterium]|nr:response regulator [Chloroflexota bacterium]
MDLADQDIPDEPLPITDVFIEASGPPARAVSTGHILLVDDDEDVLLTLGAILQREGHQVSGARDLASARALLKDRRFDILIIDLRLGQDDGLDVLRMARGQDQDLVGIVITAYATLESAIAALKGGAFSYLLKPCQIEDLKEAIAAGLHRRALAEATRLAAQAAHDRSARLAAQRIAQRATRLQELSAQLTTSLSTADVLDRVVRSAVELLECPTAGVFLTSPNDDDFHLAASQGLDQGRVQRLTCKRSLAGRVATARQSMAIE